MGVPELRQPRPEPYVCGKKDLRVYRDTVLEPGKDAGDQRQSAASVEDKNPCQLPGGVINEKKKSIEKNNSFTFYGSSFIYYISVFGGGKSKE